MKLSCCGKEIQALELMTFNEELAYECGVCGNIYYVSTVTEDDRR